MSEDVKKPSTKNQAPLTITCPHCGHDITEMVNKATASRAGRASSAKRDKQYYQDLIRKRWDKETQQTTIPNPAATNNEEPPQ